VLIKLFNDQKPENDEQIDINLNDVIFFFAKENKNAGFNFSPENETNKHRFIIYPAFWNF
jgi:hypothetical protein